MMLFMVVKLMMARMAATMKLFTRRYDVHNFF